MIMTRKIVLALFLFVVILGSVWLFALRAPQPEVGGGKIHVVASFYPIAHIASIVGGDLVTVRTLVPSGAEPHDFEPSPQDFVDIGRAKFFFYNGAGFEPWVGKWEVSGPATSVHAIDISSMLAARGVSLIDRNGTIDPHFWLDPVIYEKEVEIVRDSLIGLDPIHQDIFQNNANRFISALNDLNQHLHEGLASCAVRSIVVSHDAFGYLARQYGFLTISIAGISPDEEPAPRDLARIIASIREKGIHFIFFETIASPKLSEVIAREVGATTLVLNPIESLTPSDVQLGESYVSVMEMNLINLQKAMSCK